MGFYERLKEERIVVILRDFADHEVIPIAEALYEGGIRLLEITMNTKCASQQISMLSGEFQDKLMIGAGTVLDTEMAEQALSAGATYLITPNLDEEVIAFGKKHLVDVLPGVMTPTEIVRAYRAGASMVKLFPMASLGIKYLKEVQGPLRHIPMVAVGGVTLENVKDFIDAGAAGFGIGGSILDKEAIQRGDYEAVRRKAEAFVEAIRNITIP